MKTELRTSIVRLAALFILAGLLSGCDRIGLFDMAKDGVDVVYAMGLSGNTQLYIARPDYYKQYDTMTTIFPVRIAASGRVVLVYDGSLIYTNQESFDSWGQLNGSTPAVSFMTSQHGDEALVLDTGTQIMYRLHEDSFQQADAFTDQTDLTAALGAFSPVFMFKSHNSDGVYLIAANGADVIIFSVTDGGLNLIGTNTSIAPGAIASAGRTGDFFYMLESGSGIIYRVNISSSGAVYTYAPISATSMAVTDSGIYIVYQSAGAHLFRFNPSDGTVSGDIHMFSTATICEIQPFDRDGVAIRIQGGVDEQGVWIYKDKKLERIIPGICESMFIQ